MLKRRHHSNHASPVTKKIFPILRLHNSPHLKNILKQRKQTDENVKLKCKQTNKSKCVTVIQIISLLSTTFEMCHMLNPAFSLGVFSVNPVKMEIP